ARILEANQLLDFREDLFVHFTEANMLNDAALCGIGEDLFANEHEDIDHFTRTEREVSRHPNRDDATCEVLDPRKPEGTPLGVLLEVERPLTEMPGRHCLSSIL